MINIKTKLPEWGTSIFTIMSRMAVEHNAINLAQGFPDFNCDQELLELVSYFQNKGFNQYAPMQGVPNLRKAISEKINKIYGKHYDFDKEITVTAGATQALYTAITSVVKQGDEVILFEPAYDSYVPDILSNGGIPVYIPLNIKNYSYDWELIQNKISDKTKAIILNSPHNPTGSLISKDDIEQLEKLTRETEILIISDEVYEHITFDGEKHISLASSEELSKRTFVISSFGKTYHTTGWKMGYCAAPENLTKEFRKMHQFIVFSTNTPIQHAYAEFMKHEDRYLSLGKFYQQKRDVFINEIKSSKFKLKPCRGTYFQLLDYSTISNKSDIEFSEYLTKEMGVAVIPLSPFYESKESQSLIRICFAKTDEVLKEAAAKLEKL
ncbi:MAG: methionine aminotransferase [Ignavibacteriaceae bacterium]|nr:methionine aminotransferase [Ignavibacteriaceae bacterium]MCW8813850.1 methionine aminotransferase [Chlorobium sp.]MCW8816567.1 methionine aminotransferase [Ignavibacteriaceae bacterium]MCW8823260.1 methionine aminotransferase [Ignavibacteriaceae bacterium]MCW9095085.1 methionine aminotransferase [Ignavibacteriaceae bacterium]